MGILQAFNSIFSIILMIIIGYVLTKKQWIKDDGAKLFTKIVINISLPALMINNLMSDFNKEKLLSLSGGLIVPFLSMGLAYIIGKIFIKCFKINENRKGTFLSMFFVSNTIFIGLPVNEALFGSQSVPYVLLYYIANTTFFWTIGVFEISKDGEKHKNRFLSKDTIKRIFSPPLMGFIVAVILILFQIQLSKCIMDTCKYLGNLTTPLSMLFIGNTIYNINLKKIKFNKDMFGVIIGRFIISPLLVVILCNIFPLPNLMAKVFVIQASMPVMTNTAIVSKAYHSDHEYAAIMIAVTTILSLFIIPIYKILLN